MKTALRYFLQNTGPRHVHQYNEWVHYEFGFFSCCSINQSPGVKSNLSWSITHGSFSAPSINSSREIWPDQCGRENASNTKSLFNSWLGILMCIHIILSIVPQRRDVKSTSVFRDNCMPSLPSLLKWTQLTVFIFVHLGKYSITDILNVLWSAGVSVLL